MTGLRRPGGGRQVGVGPGAVVLHAGPGTQAGADPLLVETGDVLGPALAGVPTAGTVAPGTVTGDLPACPVVGGGSLAARLRRALGNVSAETSSPVRLAVHQQVVPPEVGVAVARSGTPTVPVVAQHHRVLVGPVVGLGTGPCLHCLDLHRRDRDPAWPALATALGHPAEQLEQLELPEALARAVEGVVLLLVSSVVTGRPVTPGLGYELGPAAPHVVARRWTAHPGCPWHR